MDVEVISLSHVLVQEDSQDMLELLERHAVQVDALYDRLNGWSVERQYVVWVDDHVGDALEDDVLHRREQERLDREFNGILDVDPQVQLFSRVASQSQDKVDIHGSLKPENADEVDDLIENHRLHSLEVLDDHIDCNILRILIIIALDDVINTA